MDEFLLSAYHDLAERVAKAAKGATVSVTPEGKFTIDSVDVTSTIDWVVMYDEYKNAKVLMKPLWNEEVGENEKVLMAELLLSKMRSHKEYEREVARHAVIKRAIVAAVIAAGHKAKLQDSRRIIVDDSDVTMDVDIKQRYEHVSSWKQRLVPNAYSIVVGPYGDRTTYPPRKDGSHNYGAIAATLIERARVRKTAITLSHNRDSARPVVDALREELGVDRYSFNGLEFEPSPAGPGAPVILKFSYQRAVTVERAREIVAALRAVGLVPEKQEEVS